MIAREPTGRTALEIRPLTIQTQVNRYAEGSVLIQSGHTHVLCTASIEESTPSWLAKSGRGWITAEYSMLPRATHTRSKRDREKVSGRTQEIQRLIGRALRACINLKELGERSILIDCDVIQADGGTRTASITGACVALGVAISQLIEQKKVSPRVWIDTVAALSVGIQSGELLVDLNYEEDSNCDVDMNFVMLGSENFVEIQGTAERNPFSKAQMDAMTDAASQAIQGIRAAQIAAFKKIGIDHILKIQA